MMKMKRFGRVVPVIVAVGFLPAAALADEIVHFANGAEMTVRAHQVDTAKGMVKLDLGGNSFISFPLPMVNKIEGAGKDLFLNPGFHPSNQAIAGGSGRGAAVADTSIQGTSAPVGYVHQQGAKGTAGIMNGEVADAIPASSIGGPDLDHPVASSRRRFNPMSSPIRGEPPQVVLPPSAPHPPVQLTLLPRPGSPSTPPPQPSPPPETTPPADPPEDPADNR